MELELPSREALQRFQKLDDRKLTKYRPYPWQKRFHNAGGNHPERMVMAANRVGKTQCAAAETAFHLTGEYPDWWEGRKFAEPVLVWCGSVTNEASRDIVQLALLGGTGEELGTGLIPFDKIVGRPKMRQAGISDVVDAVKVRHINGGLSTCVFKTYDQGWRKWQGTAPHVVWLDEEPDENNSNEERIFSEAETRILTSRGVLFITFTPLLGETRLVRHFHEEKAGTFLVTASWDDAPHLDKGETEKLMSRYPPHELQARSKGIPMMGEGAVFPISEEEITCEPFELQTYPWFARLGAVDFGIEHPFAWVGMAWDRGRDIIYIYDCFRMRDTLPVVHAEAIKRREHWVPVAWPHDGVNRAKSDGRQLHMIYRDHQVRMLAKSACYPKRPGEEKEKLGSQDPEPVIMEIYERMRTGRFKVFPNCREWFDEFRSYHRKDGKLVTVRDDLMKATQYAVMMKRYAAPNTQLSVGRKTVMKPIMTTRLDY